MEILELQHWHVLWTQQPLDGHHAPFESEHSGSRSIPATVPGTLLNALVEAGGLPDPYYGLNLEQVPGMPRIEVRDFFATRPMPEESPFRVPVWWIGEFGLPATLEDGEGVHLVLDGINYRADVWVNDVCLANHDTVVGPYRQFEFDIARAVRPGRNIVGLLIYPPDEHALSFSFVDWHPMPPDKCSGPWRTVKVVRFRGARVHSVYVQSELEANLSQARLTVVMDVENPLPTGVRLTAKHSCDAFRFSHEFTLRPGERRLVQIGPEDQHALVVEDPRLWWPSAMGEAHLETLRYELLDEAGNAESGEIRFGIRTIVAWLDEQNTRHFQVNGRDVLVRGAAWAPDLLLRNSRTRDETDVTYISQMNLNAVRFEGNFGSDYLWDLFDSHGILVFAGWTCDSQWESYERWDEEDRHIASESLASVLQRFRHHACFAAFLYGSDLLAPADIEEMYLTVLKREAPHIESVASAGNHVSEITGPTGMKMTGPYSYVPPVYWYTEAMPGVAKGFNTETGPDVCIPPIESLRRTLSPEDLRPGSSGWQFHTGLRQFRGTDIVENAILLRYGQCSTVEELTRVAQVMSYECWRSMYEAYARFRPDSSGVIGWMLSNAWPSLIWHLYDSNLYPTGGFFGAAKACEPVHVQYDYSENSVWVHNSTVEQQRDCLVCARIVSIGTDGRPVTVHEQRATVNLSPERAEGVFTLPQAENLSSVYFLLLDLEQDRHIVSANRYWLSTTNDVLSDRHIQFGTTEVLKHADLSLVRNLPPVVLEVRAERTGADSVSINLQNAGDTVAFFVQAWIKSTRNGRSILPVVWSDNCLILMPGETTAIDARLPNRGDLLSESSGASSGMFVQVECLNAQTVQTDLADENRGS